MNLQGIHSSAPTKLGAPGGSDVKVELTLTPKECMRVLTPCSKSVKGTKLIRASSKCLSCACCEPGAALSTRNTMMSKNVRACLLRASGLMDARDK